MKDQIVAEQKTQFKQKADELNFEHTQTKSKLEEELKDISKQLNKANDKLRKNRIDVVAKQTPVSRKNSKSNTP